MLGYNEMREVLLWVQTRDKADVKFAYWPKGKPQVPRFTKTVTTEEDQAFTAKLLADQVQPGITYSYELYINEKPVPLDYPTEFTTQELWQWRRDPPAFTVALGSCDYTNDKQYDRPGSPYGGDYRIFQSIHQQRPDLMLWLGDNVYLREADWYTRTGIMYRYTDARSLPELQPLLASTHHYAIWDDHDFGPNDADRSFVHKTTTLEAFKLFWGNPSYGLPHAEGGITTYFQYNDIDFFLLDDRYYRAPNYRKTGKRTMLGEQQLEWIIDALVKSDAPFKMVAVGGQVLNTAEVYETYSNLFPEERDYLLQRIEQEDITNVIFLTGDRHHTELSTMTNGAGNVVYDFTCSPLTSGAARNPEQNNALREAGTLVTKRNFGVLEFSGPRAARKLTMRVFDVDGQEQWSRSIQSQDDN